MCRPSASPFVSSSSRAGAFTMVACPCALVISTPVAIISAISNAARNGVLIKGGAYLEALATVKAIAFDKTGTLTEGKPAVTKVRAVNCTNTIGSDCENCNDLLALANAVEKRSEHPLARAIVNAAAENKLDGKYVTAEDVKAIMGKGVVGHVSGQEVLIGSHGYFDQVMPHDKAQCDEIAAASATGQTPMLVGADGQYLGYISVADSVRESSRQAISALNQFGIRATVMLTGDNAATAQTIVQLEK